MARINDLGLAVGLVRWGEYHKPALMTAAKDMPCIRHWLHKGQIVMHGVVRAHYTGEYQHLFGKGTGQKCDDHCAAYLCHACHLEADDPSVEWPEGSKSELFMLYALLTLAIDLRKGVIK